MRMTGKIVRGAIYAILGSVFSFSPVAVAASGRVLLVHSYHQGYSWTDSITAGVEEALKGSGIELEIFYMDTKRRSDTEWKIKSGKAALAKLNSFHPDVVIAADDNAQEYFARGLAGKKSPVDRDEKVIGALGVSFYLDGVSALIKGKLSFPDNLDFYAINDARQILLHSQEKFLFNYLTLRSSSFVDGVNKILSKPQGIVRYEFEGKTKTSFFKQADFTGWHYAVVVESQNRF